MKRALQRAAVCTAAVLAATAFTAGAATAADTSSDLELKVTGTTLALGADGKQITVTVNNLGPDMADGFTVTFDTTALDKTKVSLTLPSGCSGESCHSPATMGSSESWDSFFRLDRLAGATGGAGKLKVSVSSATSDPDLANNSATVDVVLSEVGGVDLLVYAEDVYQTDSEGNITDQPVLPGQETLFWALAFNQGTKTAQGSKVSVTLPEGVTFADTEPDCTYSSDNRVATCTYADNVLEPGSLSDPSTWSWYYWPVKVASTVSGPVNLSGGQFTLEALAEVDTAPQARGTRPHGAAPRGIEPNDFKDIDPSDNTDGFIVHVGNAGGQGGGLPVTGDRVALFAGVGGAAVAAGLVLFLASRRRRARA